MRRWLAGQNEGATHPMDGLRDRLTGEEMVAQIDRPNLRQKPDRARRPSVCSGSCASRSARSRPARSTSGHRGRKRREHAFGLDGFEEQWIECRARGAAGATRCESVALRTAGRGQGALRPRFRGAGSWIRTLCSVIAHHSAPQCLEPDPRNPSGPAVRWPHSTGRTHDRSRSSAVYANCLLPDRGRPYMTEKPEPSAAHPA